MISIRPWIFDDAEAIWLVMEPIIRAGETYTFPRDWDKNRALAYWTSSDSAVFVAEENGAVIGTYFIRPNQGNYLLD